jgi:hypothetical protein
VRFGTGHPGTALPITSSTSMDTLPA